MQDLIAPHGGLTEPVDRTVPEAEVAAFREKTARLPRVPVSDGTCADFAPARYASLHARSSRLNFLVVARRFRRELGSVAPLLPPAPVPSLRNRSTSRRQHPNRSEHEYDSDATVTASRGRLSVR